MAFSYCGPSVLDPSCAPHSITDLSLAHRPIKHFVGVRVQLPLIILNHRLDVIGDLVIAVALCGR
jgi:hypothetical protein